MSETKFDECEGCGEMLVLVQCEDCGKWLCMRCIYDHQCKDNIWVKK